MDPAPAASVLAIGKTTGVGEEERGYDRAKNIRSRKRHLLVDTEGFVLKANIHSARLIDQEGIKLLLHHAGEKLPCLSHLWLDAGYRGKDKGKGWVKKGQRLGGEGFRLECRTLERPRKPAPEEMLMNWAAEWAKEGKVLDWRKLVPPRGFQVLPRRWVVERSFAWIWHNRRMSLGTTRGCVPRARHSSMLQ